MDYKTQYRALVEGGRERARLAADFAHQTEFLPILRRLRLKHGTYLAWAALFQGLQAVEVFLLAWKYFLFLPPQSLQILRVLSSLSLLPILVALQVRVDRDFRPRRDRDTRRHAERIAVLAQTLSCGMATVATAILVYLLAATRLTHSSPPIYLAVVATSLLLLPVEALNTFCIYQRSSLNRIAPLPVSRTVGALGGVLALLALLGGFPIAYLLLKVAPRARQAVHLWREIRAEARIPFFTLTWLGDRAARRQLGRFAGDAWFPVATYLLIEAGFLAVFLPLERAQPQIGVTLYLVTRCYHLAVNLGFKVELVRIAAGYCHRIAGNSAVLRTRFWQWMKIQAAQLIFVFPFIPLFLLKRLSLVWLSTAGELPSDTLVSYVGAVGLAGHRVILGSLVAWTVGCRPEKSLLRRLAAFFIVEWSIVALASTRIFAGATADQALAFWVVTEIALGTGLMLSLAPLYRRLRPIIHREKNDFSFPQLWRRLGQRPFIVAYAEFWPGLAVDAAAEEAALLTAGLTFARWGRNGYFFVVEASDERILDGWINDRSSIIRTFRRVAGGPSDAWQALASCLGTETDAERVPRDLYLKAFGMSSPDLEVGRAHGGGPADVPWPERTVRVAKGPDGWDLSGLTGTADPSAYENVLTYISRCEQSGEWLDPTLARLARFRGIVNWHEAAGNPAVLYIPRGSRARLAQFEAAAFARNFRLICGEGGSFVAEAKAA